MPTNQTVPLAIADLTPALALVEAVRRIGSQSATARLCEVSQAAVWKWLHEEKPVPHNHVRKVAAATGIPKNILRPDLFGPDDADGPISGPNSGEVFGSMEPAR